MTLTPTPLAAAASRRVPLMTHLVLGHPSLAESLEVAMTYAQAQVAYLEVQLPFSHPTADGQTITDANRAALRATPDWEVYWQGLAHLAQHVAPERLVVMTYANRIVGAQGGPAAFAARLAGLGLRQLIVPDLPVDAPAGQALLAEGLDLFPVLAPNTAPKRLERLLAHGPRLAYIMAGYRLTGQAFGLDARLTALTHQIKQRAPATEVGIGFGIRSAADVAQVRRVADIAIIGSAAEVQQRIADLAGIGVTDFAAVEFGGTPDEAAETREALKGLLT